MRLSNCNVAHQVADPVDEGETPALPVSFATEIDPLTSRKVSRRKVGASIGFSADNVNNASFHRSMLNVP